MTDKLLNEMTINVLDAPTPTGDAHSDEEHQRLVKLDRVTKLKIVFVAAFCLPLISYISYFVFDLTAPQTIGVLVSFSHLSYFFSLISALFKAKYLYRVQPRYRVISDWANMSMPCHMDQYPQYPIFSISEFSSIRGTLSNLFLFAVGLFTLTAYLSLFLQNESKWNTEDITSKIAAILSFGAGVGLTWIGIFELNPNDKFQKTMHYVGVVICGLSNVGFCLQQNWSVYSVLLLCGLLTFGIIWQYFCSINHQKGEFSDIREVTKVSIICISMETILLAFGALAFNSYLFYFDRIFV